MARTVKNEHATDGWHTSCRIWRTNRPAGRLHSALVEALDEMIDDGYAVRR